jgi:glutamate dehydrogenase/leucine dehydrogenase
MSSKCGFADLPYGGGKGGATVDPAASAMPKNMTSPVPLISNINARLLGKTANA